jgi:hypothetical protein
MRAVLSSTRVRRWSSPSGIQTVCEKVCSSFSARLCPSQSRTDVRSAIPDSTARKSARNEARPVARERSQNSRSEFCAVT